MALPLHSRIAERVTDHVEKPEVDDRTYRVIRLPNKLEALLIHDPEADKASAALDVNAGSWADYEHLPGIAHAVEHLLFMGTEKFPTENEYSQYLSANAGYSNAFTAANSTNYHFEVAAKAEDGESSEISADGSVKSPLYGALDRFSQFFIAPLFLEGSLDRELRAVDSENKKNLQSDMWRLNQLAKSLSNPEHPYHHFSTGSLQTLRDDPLSKGVKIREEFMGFHRQHYSANRMKLAVLGRESLDTLEQWVEEMFSPILNKDLQKMRWDNVPLWREEDKGIVIHAKPVMESRSLEICFEYQDEENMWETQPSRYLSNLIGHEGPGSILAYLKSQGWANGLSAGNDDLGPGSAFFEVAIKLTPQGLENYAEVVKTVFQYIALMRENPPIESFFDEIKTMSNVNFRFKQKEPADRTTSGLSGRMQEPLPRDLLLKGGLQRFDPDGVTKAMSYLRPDNFRLMIISQDKPLPGNVEKEKWYGTEYSIEKLSKEFISDLEKAMVTGPAQRPKDLYLPGPNEFVPRRLDVEKKDDIKTPAIAPKLVRREANVRLWFKKDDQFFVPKANFFVRLRNPIVDSSPRYAVLSQLFCSLVVDALEEYAYDAELAGLQYSLFHSNRSLSLSVGGYNDKMSVLLEKVLTTMRDMEIKPERFEIIKERSLRSYRNVEYNPPYYQLGHHSSYINFEVSSLTEHLLPELESITVEDVRAFRPLILGQAHVEALAHGNLHLEDALKLCDLVEDTLKLRTLPASQWPVDRSILLAPGANYCYTHELRDEANVNHCIGYVLYVGDVYDRVLANKLALFAQMTSEPAFNVLRTQEQLGYVVFSGVVKYGTQIGYRVLIQSERDPEYLEQRIERFLRNFGDELEKMSDETFKSHRRSVINDRLEKIKNLNQESRRFWNHVTSELYFFDHEEDDVKNLKTLTKPDLIEFYKHFINPASEKTRAKMSVHLRARGSSSPASADQPNGDATAAEPQPFENTSEAPSPGSATSRAIPPEDQKTSFMAFVEQYLNTLGFEDTKESALRGRFRDVDISGGDADAMLEALKKYLQDDLKMVADEVKLNIERAESVLPEVLETLGVKVVWKSKLAEQQKKEAAETPVVVAKPTMIEDVRSFKSSLPLAKGATPIRDISQFEDLAPKL